MKLKDKEFGILFLHILCILILYAQKVMKKLGHWLITKLHFKLIANLHLEDDC